MANIRRDEKHAFTALIWPREGGGEPHTVWILEELPGGWLVEEVVRGDTGGWPPKQEFYSDTLWTRDEREAQTTVDVAATLPKLGPWPLVRP
jgi:hypothetical protein